VGRSTCKQNAACIKTAWDRNRRYSRGAPCLAKFLHQILVPTILKRVLLRVVTFVVVPYLLPHCKQRITTLSGKPVTSNCLFSFNVTLPAVHITECSLFLSSLGDDFQHTREHLHLACYHNLSPACSCCQTDEKGDMMSANAYCLP
jgi:hypothetical protein